MKKTTDNQKQGMGGGSQTKDQAESPLQVYLPILLRGKWIILASVVVVLGLFAYYSLSQKPIYEASTLVLIDLKGKDVALPTFSASGSAGAYKMTNELEILKSNSTLDAVARELLARKYLSDDSTKLIPIILASTEGASQGSLAKARQVSGRLSGEVEFTPIRESDIIRITAQSTVPEEAALIANVYTQVYVSRNLNTSRMRSQAVSEFLQGQFQSKRGVLDAAESDLQKYMKRTGVVSLDAEGNKVVEQLSALEAQRDGLQVERTSKLKILASYKEELASQEPKAAAAMGESNDSYIRLLQEQLAKLEVQRDIVISQNPGMVNAKLYTERLGEINTQISALRKTLTERTQSFLNAQLPGRVSAEGNASFLGEVKQKIIEQQIELGGFDERIKALNGVIAEYEKKFNAIPEKSIELAKLQRARLSSEKLYLLVEEKYNEAAIKEKSEFGYLNIVDPAVVPRSPVGGGLVRNLILGFLAGLILGVGIVFMRAFTDTRIRTPQDLKHRGFVPLSTVGLMDGELKKIQAEIAAAGGRNRFDPHLIAHHRPLAPIAESYRHLRTNLLHVLDQTPLRCFVVTSTNPQEGKTTTVSNLAISFSQAEKKVLLVDVDMRRPSIHTKFGLRPTPGLNDHLFGNATIEQVIKTDVLPNLDVIVGGTNCPNPAEVLGSEKMKEFIAQMKQRYELVIFDSPPLLAVTDAAVLARETDGVLIVVSAGETRSPELEQISEFLVGIGAKVMGVMLNKFDIREVYGGYYASYHYGYYGYESGYYGKDGKKKSRRLFNKTN
jgi:capsular exopolysaccharide synthesis family protein